MLCLLAGLGLPRGFVPSHFAAASLHSWHLSLLFACLQPVGRMVLNRNPDNFFNENEQVAFCPALVVPGEWTRCCQALFDPFFSLFDPVV